MRIRAAAAGEYKKSQSAGDNSFAASAFDPAAVAAQAVMHQLNLDMILISYTPSSRTATPTRRRLQKLRMRQK
uniref:Uncharacterized protein n=1 Tax=Hyaloperonospora arabidopsidis (strain Emoy2) TaxID=559515 RepID=M4BI88_HYAAE